MNINQLSYYGGRVLLSNYDLVYSTTGAYSLYSLFETLPCAPSFSAGFALITLFCVRKALHYRKQKSRLRSEIRCLDEEFHPLEFVEKVRIEDIKGLESLLQRTAKKEWKEWGTVFHVYEKDKNAVIDKIINSDEGKEYFLKAGFRGMKLNIRKMEREKFNGVHHYHPRPSFLGGTDFALPAHNDRSAGPENWFKLLTFNLPEGPEIIGFNRQFTYLPANKEKTELVRATHEDILKYLG